MMTNNPNVGRAWGLTLLCVWGLAGCGDAGPRVVPVSGTVTRNGNPVAGVTLHFCPDKGQGRASWGLSDDQGHFVLYYEKKRQGALTGAHRVYVEFKPKSAKEEDLAARDQWLPHPEYTAIVEKYGSLQKTPLTLQVGPEEHQSIAVKLD